MTAALADIFALASGIAGWFYLFYSKAAARLSTVEPSARNQLRIILRRICGGAMVALGAAFFAGSNAVDGHRSPAAFLAIWIGAILLLFLILVLVSADILLTLKMRRQRTGNPGNRT